MTIILLGATALVLLALLFGTTARPIALALGVNLMLMFMMLALRIGTTYLGLRITALDEHDRPLLSSGVTGAVAAFASFVAIVNIIYSLLRAPSTPDGQQ